MSDAATLFTPAWTAAAFPAERADMFFEALFGGAEEGAYDISLRFVKHSGTTYEFSLDLTQRPGMCLACNLTYGLPQVFSRHPVINVAGVARDVATALGKDPAAVTWNLAATKEQSRTLHSIPLLVTVS